MVGWHQPLHGHEFEETEILKDGETRHAAVHGVANSPTGLSDCTTPTITTAATTGPGSGPGSRASPAPLRPPRPDRRCHSPPGAEEIQRKGVTARQG